MSVSLTLSSPDDKKLVIKSNKYLTTSLDIELSDLSLSDVYNERISGFEHILNLDNLVLGKLYSINISAPGINAELKGEFICGADAALRSYQFAIMASLRSWLIKNTTEDDIFLVEVADSFLNENPVKFILIEPTGGETLESRKHSLRQTFSIKVYGRTRTESISLDSFITSWLRDIRNYSLLNSCTIVKSVTYTSGISMVDEVGWYYSLRELNVHANIAFHKSAIERVV